MSYAIDFMEGLNTLKSVKKIEITPVYESPPHFKFLKQDMGIGDIQEEIMPHFSIEEYKKYLSEELRLRLSRVGVEILFQGNELVYVEIYSDRSVEVEIRDAEDEEGLDQVLSNYASLKGYKLHFGDIGIEK